MFSCVANDPFLFVTIEQRVIFEIPPVQIIIHSNVFLDGLHLNGIFHILRNGSYVTQGTCRTRPVMTRFYRNGRTTRFSYGSDSVRCLHQEAIL